MNNFLQKILFVLLLLLPVFDSIYKFRDGASPAVIVRAAVVIIMLYLLIRTRPLKQSQKHIVGTVVLLLAYIAAVSIVFAPESWTYYNLIRLAYPFLGFILIYYLAKESSMNEKSLAIFYMLLIFVLAISSYINIGQRMNTIKELNEADNIGYALLCAFAGIMLFTKRKVFFFAIFFVWVGTLISGKRGAIVGMALASLPLLKFIFTSYSRDPIKKVFFGFFMFFAVIMAMRWFNNIFDATLSRFENLAEDGGSGRNHLYLEYWLYFKHSDPIHQLFGHGLFAGASSSGSKYAFTQFFAHNDWLELLFDFGIVGVGLYLLVMVKIMMVIIHNRKNKNTYYYMLLISFIIWFTKSIVSSTFFIDVSSIYLYMTTAYAMAKLKPSMQNSVNPQSAFQTHL